MIHRPGRWRFEKLGIGDLAVIVRNGRSVGVAKLTHAKRIVGALQFAEAVFPAPRPRSTPARLPARGRL
jgi:hypothetical protein